MSNRNRLYRLILLFLLLVTVWMPGLTAPRFPIAAAQELPSPTATPAANARPDRCERNDSPAQTCVLALDAVNGPFTFIPEGDQDYYSVDLGAEPSGLALEITVRATAGLDLLTAITPAGATAPLAVLSSPVVSTTLPADLTGWVVIRVENRAPALAVGESYNLELRQVLPPPPPPPEALAAQPAITPDRLENNWNPQTAAPIGVGFVYELNFVCPIPGGCQGGDHDYLSVPVKAGLRYLITTFDLGPGVDTVIDLFWGDQQTPIATNDDARPGSSFLSVLRWVAPADGQLIIRVGPRTAGAGQVVFDSDAGSYRFAIALAESDLARQLEQRIADQTNAPTPTSRAATGGGSTNSAPRPTLAVAGDGPTGEAVVVAHSTVLREQPEAGAPAIQTLAQAQRVSLLGQVSGAWVRVQPEGGVVPGWVHGPALERIAPGATPAAITAPQPTSAATSPGVAPTVASATVTPTPALPQLSALDPAPPPPPGRAPARERLTVTCSISVASGASRPTPAPGRPVPTAAPGTRRPLAGVRVQLVNVFGDVLAETITAAGGQVLLTRDLAPTTAVFVRVPALGIQVAVDRAEPVITITLPEGDTL